MSRHHNHSSCCLACSTVFDANWTRNTKQWYESHYVRQPNDSASVQHSIVLSINMEPRIQFKNLKSIELDMKICGVFKINRHCGWFFTSTKTKWLFEHFRNIARRKGSRTVVEPKIACKIRCVHTLTRTRSTFTNCWTRYDRKALTVSVLEREARVICSS